jgi:cbb3-type cytochrome oxidase maturation protein
MEVIIILLPLAILLAFVFIASYVWMTWNGQYDDLETPPFRMLLDASEFSPSSKNFCSLKNNQNQNTTSLEKKDET